MGVSEIQISYHPKVKLQDSPKVTSSEDAYRILIDHWSDDIQLRETFYIMLLNRANKVKGIVPISKGGIVGTVADIRIIFSIALKTMSTGIIMAHNHPSGNLKPSKADTDLTQRCRKAGGLLDINMLDHLIVTEEGYWSFADEGALK